MKQQKDIDELLQAAETIARDRNHEYMFTEHVLMAMINNKEFYEVLVDYDVDLIDFKADLVDYLDTKIAKVERVQGQ